MRIVCYEIGVKKKDKPNVVTIKEGVETIAALGGFRITESGQPPGCEALWLGYHKLCGYVYIIKQAREYLGFKNNEFM